MPSSGSETRRIYPWAGLELAAHKKTALLLENSCCVTVTPSEEVQELPARNWLLLPGGSQVETATAGPRQTGPSGGSSEWPP